MITDKAQLGVRDWVAGTHIGVRFCFFFQAEDGIRDLVRSRGLGDVYKRQPQVRPRVLFGFDRRSAGVRIHGKRSARLVAQQDSCLLYTSDAADERSSVDLGGRRIIKKKKENA